MTDTLTIPRTLANKLLTLAQHAPESEVCGLISRTEKPDYRVYPIDNIAIDSTSVFAMEPQQQINAFRQMREGGETLFAIFHSHPHSEAIPSKKDLDDAAYAEALNIIISLSTEGVLDMRGYYYRNNQIEAVDLSIE